MKKVLDPFEYSIRLDEKIDMLSFYASSTTSPGSGGGGSGGGGKYGSISNGKYSTKKDVLNVFIYPANSTRGIDLELDFSSFDFIIPETGEWCENIELFYYASLKKKEESVSDYLSRREKILSPRTPQRSVPRSIPRTLRTRNYEYVWCNSEQGKTGVEVHMLTPDEFSTRFKNLFQRVVVETDNFVFLKDLIKRGVNLNLIPNKRKKSIFQFDEVLKEILHSS